MYEIDHIGIAVKDMDAAIANYQNNFGFALDSREKLEHLHVEVAFLKLPNTLLEFVCPLSDKSSISKFLEKRGEGLHHICYKVTDIRAELKKFAEKGHELIDKEPRQGAYNSLIAFIRPENLTGILTELCQHQSMNTADIR